MGATPQTTARIDSNPHDRRAGNANGERVSAEDWRIALRERGLEPVQ